MPTLNKVYQLNITPEQFIEACSDTELQELELLCQSKIRQRQERLKEMNLIDMEVDHNDEITKEDIGLLSQAERSQRLKNIEVIDPDVIEPCLGHNGMFARCAECSKIIRTS